jgi:hypothetical protein
MPTNNTASAATNSCAALTRKACSPPALPWLLPNSGSCSAKTPTLAAFTDYGYLENLTDRNRFFLRPWGLGAGLNFETQAGIFGINLAVGRRDAGQAVDWRAPKFHLGYVSLF